MKPILDILSSISKLTLGRERQSLPVTSSSSVVYANNDINVLLGFALILVAIALILSVSKQYAARPAR